MDAMDAMDEDTIFEDLPPKLRKQVLKFWQTGEIELGPTVKTYKPQGPSIAFLALPVVLSVPVFLIGLVLTCTVLFAPVGIPLMVIACVPTQRVLRNHDYSKD